MTHLKATNSLYKCLRQPIRLKKRAREKGASLVCDITQGINEMALQRLRELPIKYIKYTAAACWKCQPLRRLMPSQRFKQELVTRFPLCSRQRLSESNSEKVQVKSKEHLRLERDAFVGTARNLPPLCWGRNHMNRCYQKRSQTSISGNVRASVRHERTDGGVSKNSPGPPYRITTVFIAEVVNSYLGLRAPDPPLVCVGGGRACADIESIPSSCLKFI